MAYNVEKLSTIDLGRQGENLARTVEIDVSSLLAQWPNAIISLLCKRKHDSVPYIAVTEVKDGMLIWPITSVETEAAGDGKIELRAVCGEIIAKSMTAVIRVTASLTGSETEAPDAAQGWVDQVLAAGSGVEANAIRAEEAADHAEGYAVQAEEAVARAEEVVATIGDSVEQAQEASRQAGEEAAAAEASAEQARQIAEDVSAEAERIETAVADAELAADKIDGMKVSAETLEAGLPATVTIADDGTVKTISFGIPKGDPGEKPVRGEDYWTAEDKEQVISEAVSETLEQVKTISFYFCSAEEVDENGMPVITAPDDHTFYLVPSGEEEPNLFIEWVYLNGKWERFGSATIDLSGYVKKTDLASSSSVGVVTVHLNYGVETNSTGRLQIARATLTQIDAKISEYKPIVPFTLDYAVKKGLSDSKLADTDNAWTEEEKAAARELLGAVGKEDYATNTVPGVVQIGSGLRYDPNVNKITTQPASETSIKNRTDTYGPITPTNLDYAVKVGVTTNTISLSDEEQSAAQEWLGTGKIINDSKVVTDHTWSSQRMLEKLTMPFEKSGSIVQCHPVENSPLSVKAEIRPVQHLDWMSKAGASSQVTTTGANMFDPTTAISTASYIASALPTGIQLKAWGSSIIGHDWVVEHLKPSTVYYVKCKIKKTAEPGDDYTAHGLDKRLLLYSPNGGGSVSLVNWNTACAVGESKDFAVSFTTPDGLLDETLNYSIYGYSEYYTKEGAQASAATIEITDLIISETDVEYEPYTGGKPSPSPEYPQEIVDSVPTGSYYVPSTAFEGGYWKITLEESLGGIGEYHDVLEVDAYTGKYRIIRKTGNRSFDGSEAWYTNEGRNYVALGNWCNREEDDTGQTDYGQKCSHAIFGNDHDSGRYLTHKSGSVSWILFGGTSDVQAWKDFLAKEYEDGHPVTANFGRAKPVVTSGQAEHVASSSGLTGLPMTQVTMNSPSPQYPCQIGAADTISLSHYGKNLLDPNAQLTAAPTPSYLGIDMMQMPAGDYTLSVRLKEGATLSDKIIFGIAYVYPGAVAAGALWNILNGKIKETGVAVINPSAYKQCGVCVYPATQECWNAVMTACDVMLEVGNKATEYVPYQGISCSIPLFEGFVGGNVDVTGGSITSKMAKYQFTGDETFNYSGSQVSGYITVYTAEISPAPTYAPYAKILPSCTVAKGSIGIVGAENQFALNSNTSHFLRLSTGTLTGYSDDWTEAEKIAGVKAYLKEQYDAGTPVTIFYEVSETVETATPQVISALDGVNTIYSNAQSITVSGRESPIHTIETLTKRIDALENVTAST